MRTRAFVRATPRSPVSVVFEKAGEPLAYGAVANISDGGACVWTSGRFEARQEVFLSLSGARQPQPLQVSAVITWGGPASPRERGSRRYGLQWLAPTSESRSGLRRLIGL